MIVIYVVSFYLIVGVAFALLFIIRWVTRLDEASTESGWSFRLMIFPGCVVFWPILLKKLVNPRGHD